MSLIDGIGDEVIHFIVVTVVTLVGIIAWWSTNARLDGYRTVLVMRSRPQHPVTVSIRTRSNTHVTFTQTSIDESTVTPGSASNTSNNSEESTTENRVIPVQEMDSIVDADIAMMDEHRLHFYRRIDSQTEQPATESTSRSEDYETQEESAASGDNVQKREMDSIVNAMEADLINSSGLPAVEENKAQSANNKRTSISEGNETTKLNNSQSATSGAESVVKNVPVTASADNIHIKIKYLNETFKEVEGNLEELLKDFKWRHFSSEMSNSRVRLVFRGRVLEDAATLRACGLYDKAVVHCLVHQGRPNSNQARSDEVLAEETGELLAEAAAPQERWELENILMTLVSVALTVVWFFRCEYSSMFTASASVALFGLTVFYSVAVFGLYLSDAFHFERRHAHAHPPQVPAF